MNGIVDFHSHVLPGVDDGSATVEESLALLRLESAQGIRRVVATPHFYPGSDSPERFLARRNEAESRLREAMAGHEDLPEVICGAEVYFFSGIGHCEILSELTIGRGRCLLVEMPHGQWTQKMYAELEQIHSRWGITPVIAHVDRYLGIRGNRDIPKRLAQMPVLVQANASFFLGAATRHKAFRMLKRDQIQLLGSDCHNLHSRPPRLGEALRNISGRLSPDVLERIRSYQDEALHGQNSL